MTNYDGRCRGGWAFGQGFDSPQVHRKRGLRVYSQASFSMDLRGSLVCVRARGQAFGRGPRRPVGAQGPVDLGSARTEVKRRPSVLGRP